MNEESEPKYTEISLSILKRFKRPLIFDIYVKRSEGRYTKIFNVDEEIDWDRVITYEQKGIKFFYVTEEDYEKYTIYVERLGEQLTQFMDKLSNEEILDLMKEMVNFSMHDIVENYNINERSVNVACNVINGCIKGIASKPKQIFRLVSLFSAQPELIKHSITVSIFSLVLAQASGIGNEQALEHIGLGAFLHDIGQSQLDFDPHDEEMLTKEQRKSAQMHPEMGKQLLDIIPGVRTEVMTIVAQHHERKDGTGYPNNLKGDNIYKPAQVVAICDTFVNYITSKTFREAYSPEIALSKLKTESGKFDRTLIKLFSKILFP